MCNQEIKDDFFIRYDQIDNKIYLTHCCRIESKAYSLEELEERGLQSLIEEASTLEQVIRPGSEKLCKKTCKYDLQPKSIFIQAIGLCNFHCFHCSSGHGDIKCTLLTKNPLKNKKVFFNLIEHIKKLNYDTSIIVDGSGEIFIYYNTLLDTLKSLKNTNIKQITFETNASLLDEEKINTLKKLSQETNVEYLFRVSIDGISKETHEKVRPTANYEQLIKVFKILSETFTTTINFTIKRPNVMDTPKVDEYFKNLFPKANLFIEYDFFDSDFLKEQLNDEEGKYSCLFIPRLQD